MKRFSEFVSLGHPDKIADYISQYILDRYIERDPDTRYAVEVQIKNYRVTLGGEVSSNVAFTNADFRRFCCEAVEQIGYNDAYVLRWGADNAICGRQLEVESLISQQSPDIARGLDGWGDQGIFFGFATPDASFGYMPKDHAIAKRLCKALFDSGVGGLDIKTQVVMSGDTVEKIIAAIPLQDDASVKTVKSIVRKCVNGRCEVVVNGTGRYVRHSSIADCGTTGRKLAVDFYGGSCKIGGGSPWTKDASKADLTLNLAARKIALSWAKSVGVPCIASLACCIGRREVDACVTDEAGNVLYEGLFSASPERFRHDFGLDKPIYAEMCRWGLFGEFQKDKGWEYLEGLKSSC